MTAVYDFRATPLVNAVADEAMAMINQLRREDSDQLIDMRSICFWSAQAAAPSSGDAVHRQIAYEASIVISHALALDRAVAACREHAA